MKFDDVNEKNMRKCGSNIDKPLEKRFTFVNLVTPSELSKLCDDKILMSKYLQVLINLNKANISPIATAAAEFIDKYLVGIPTNHSYIKNNHVIFACFESLYIPRIISPVTLICCIIKF